MTEFGSQDVGNTEVAPMVGKEFGFLATGNGDRIDLNIRKKESRPKSDLGRLSNSQQCSTLRIDERVLSWSSFEISDML